jgi:hypothetical protein
VTGVLGSVERGFSVPAIFVSAAARGLGHAGHRRSRRATGLMWAKTMAARSRPASDRHVPSAVSPRLRGTTFDGRSLLAEGTARPASVPQSETE